CPATSCRSLPSSVAISTASPVNSEPAAKSTEKRRRSSLTSAGSSCVISSSPRVSRFSSTKPESPR
ncbi:MAG: hypothetical protein ACK559_11870, partial [bacterium]